MFIEVNTLEEIFNRELEASLTLREMESLEIKSECIEKNPILPLFSAQANPPLG